ncbi:hypothetical protein [Variovorax guangxiensis]|uniref:Uncharacterized protein n=1 Tax=Variovorax guangxiensis TaxID=1775474 RepID=A0A840G0K8_9BURK|nr:hypothetical protein [Variovorax guangxiensis]MBB4226015.1 hypothetical protein [Variovorax guangxiensis]
MKYKIKDEQSGEVPADHVILSMAGTSTTMTLAEWSKEKSRRDARHARGFYTMEEAAEVMAAEHGFDAENFLWGRMHPAVAGCELELIDENDGMPVRTSGHPIRHFADWVTPQGMNKWLRASGSIFLWPESETPPQSSTDNSAPQSSQSPPGMGTESVLKRSALVEKHQNQWPTIDRDLKDGGENGLSEAAKHQKHGMWFEDRALAWARQQGKLKPETHGAPVNSIFNAPGRKHRMGD